MANNKDDNYSKYFAIDLASGKDVCVEYKVEKLKNKLPKITVLSAKII